MPPIMLNNPLELAILSQLVQGDKQLNRDLKVLCSSFCNSSVGDNDEDNNIDNDESVVKDGVRQTSTEVQALRNAASLYKDLSLWSSLQTQLPLKVDEASFVGKHLLQRCRRLGFLDFPMEESLETLPETAAANQKKKPVKIFCDGVFDLMHAGHFNALRQAAQLGDELYVGVCSDDGVLEAKGVHPLYTVDERAEIVKACKWVKDVIVGCPYDITLKFFKTTGCDFVVHGDDLALNGQGEDCYEEIRKAGLFKVFKRTEGVSTTTIVARLLGVVDSVPNTSSQLSAPTPAHQFIHNVSKTPRNNTKAIDFNNVDAITHTTVSDDEDNDSPTADHGVNLAMKQTILSSRRLAQFMGTPRTPPPGAKIVYTDGSFDIFHNGHVRVFEKAKAMGDFLIVGIYDDATVKHLKGPGYPIQPMLDRALSVMAMRCVDEVVMGVPADPTEHFVKTFNINTIVRGMRMDTAGSSHQEQLDQLKGVCEVVMIESESLFTTELLVERIKGNREKLRSSISKRQVKEHNFYNDASKACVSEL